MAYRISYYGLIVTWMLDTPLSHVHTSLLHMLTARVYMHVLFLSSCHHRTYDLYYCSMLPYACYMIVSCYWYGYSRYWTWELLICDMWNPTSIIPVSRYIVPVILFPFPVILFYAINRAQVQLSCYPYHVLYLFLLHCILDISDHKANWGMGKTRRLIRSYRVMYWIHIVSPTAGDGSAAYQ